MVDRRVIRVEELESDVSFLKFFSRSIFLQRTLFFIRVDRRVIRVEELESDVSFLKFFFGSIFLLKGPLFYEK
jgi:hypothetical protein